MSRIPCNVNKDLLPLYVDDVCSEESKSMVEEHLAGCEECQTYYDALKAGIPQEKIEEEKEELMSEEKMRAAAVSVIKAAKKEISKSQVRKAAGIVAAMFIAWFLLEGINGSYMGGWLEKIPIFDIRLKADDIRVTEMYELKNGYLYITVKSDKRSQMCYAGNLQEIIDEKNGFTGEYKGFFGLENAPLAIDSIPMESYSFIFPLSKRVKEYGGEIKERENSAIYLEGKGDKQIKVWEKGQKVEKAPPEIEAEAREEIEKTDAWLKEDNTVRKGEITYADAAEDAASNVYIISRDKEEK